MIQFRSTRASPAAPLYRFEQAIFANIADDGGLFLPQTHPQLPMERAAGLARDEGFAALATLIAPYYDPILAYSPAVYREQIFPFSPRLTRLDERLLLLELYHGPTCAFKDFGAAFLAHTISQALTRQRKRIVILTATSGDTGSAVAHAFHRKENIDVVILYPANRVSKLQEAHLNSFADNIHSIRVRGTFDSCQALVKRAFRDPDCTGRIAFASANSINIGRLLPQSFYYHYAFHLAQAMMPNAPIHFCVPSGNIGNVTAGVLAWRGGLPVSSFIIAANSNRAVPLYLARGSYKPRRTVRTISNAMDVGAPSNFERLRALYDNSHAQMTRHLSGYWASERETRSSIAAAYSRYGVVIDPHTATALSAADKALASAHPPRGGVVCLATAHPCKFSDTVERVLRRPPPPPPAVSAYCPARRRHYPARRPTVTSARRYCPARRHQFAAACRFRHRHAAIARTHRIAHHASALHDATRVSAGKVCTLITR